MASPTPGVLLKLLKGAGNKEGDAASVTPSSHRSPLLQVIEIVPSLADDRWRSDGFFLKVSDSLHASYVAVLDEDADCVRADKIRLGQLVYVQGGVHAERGCPVPVLRGLKPIPKRRPCLGNPTDLVSSDVLVPFTRHFSGDGGDRAKNVKPKRNVVGGDGGAKLLRSKKKESVDWRRLSLDSARRAWDQSPGTPRNASRLPSPGLTSKHVLPDKKALSNRSPSMCSSSSTSPLGNRGRIIFPRPVVKGKHLKDNVKSLSKETVLSPLVKLPLGLESRSDPPIRWNTLPSKIQSLGKGVLTHRNGAFLAAVHALEEAAAAEAVIHCLQAFGELRESSQKVSAGSLVDQFLDIHSKMQRVMMSVSSLLNASESIASTNTSTDDKLPNLSHSATSKNATAWVQAAIGTNLAEFSLFKESGKLETPNSNKRSYIILENSPKDSNSEDHSCRSKGSLRTSCGAPPDPCSKGFQYSSRKHLPWAKNPNSERDRLSSSCRLKESASLAEKLLMVSRLWFLQYLEDSLNKGFKLSKGEGSNDIASLLGQLKRVNQWLDDLGGDEVGTEKKKEHLRKKLYRFLLEHVDSAVSAA